jgi:hypothetical protein
MNIMEMKTTGFASPAQGYEEQTIDLNRLLIRNPRPPTLDGWKPAICNPWACLAAPS